MTVAISTHFASSKTAAGTQVIVPKRPSPPGLLARVWPWLHAWLTHNEKLVVYNPRNRQHIATSITKERFSKFASGEDPNATEVAQNILEHSGMDRLVDLKDQPEKQIRLAREIAEGRFTGNYSDQAKQDIKDGRATRESLLVDHIIAEASSTVQSLDGKAGDPAWIHKFTVECASKLIQADGTLDLPLARALHDAAEMPDVARRLGAHRPDFQKMLRHLEDHAFRSQLVSIGAPQGKKNPSIDMIRETLRLPQDHVVTACDARRAALSSLLGDLRQDMGVGSCYVSSLLIFLKRELGLRYLDLLKELLERGSLKVIGKKGITEELPMSREISDVRWKAIFGIDSEGVIAQRYETRFRTGVPAVVEAGLTEALLANNPNLTKDEINIALKEATTALFRTGDQKKNGDQLIADTSLEKIVSRAIRDLNPNARSADITKMEEKAKAAYLRNQNAVTRGLEYTLAASAERSDQGTYVGYLENYIERCRENSSKGGIYGRKKHQKSLRLIDEMSVKFNDPQSKKQLADLRKRINDKYSRTQVENHFFFKYDASGIFQGDEQQEVRGVYRLHTFDGKNPTPILVKTESQLTEILERIFNPPDFSDEVETLEQLPFLKDKGGANTKEIETLKNLLQTAAPSKSERKDMVDATLRKMKSKFNMNIDPAKGVTISGGGKPKAILKALGGGVTPKFQTTKIVAKALEKPNGTEVVTDDPGAAVVKFFADSCRSEQLIREGDDDMLTIPVLIPDHACNLIPTYDPRFLGADRLHEKEIHHLVCPVGIAHYKESEDFQRTRDKYNSCQERIHAASAEIVSADETITHMEGELNTLKKKKNIQIYEFDLHRQAFEKVNSTLADARKKKYDARKRKEEAKREVDELVNGCIHEFQQKLGTRPLIFMDGNWGAPGVRHLIGAVHNPFTDKTSLWQFTDTGQPELEPVKELHCDYGSYTIYTNFAQLLRQNEEARV